MAVTIEIKNGLVPSTLSATEMANCIVSKTDIENYSFLNWDGNTTPHDFLENLQLYVNRITGYSKLKTVVLDNILTIQALDKDEHLNTLLIYDIPNSNEIYGRLRHMGITIKLLAEIHGFDFINGTTADSKQSPIRKHVFSTKSDMTPIGERVSVPQVTAKKDQLAKHPDLEPLFTRSKMTLLGYVVPNMVVASFEQDQIDEARKLYNTLGDRGLVRFRNWLDT